MTQYKNKKCANPTCDKIVQVDIEDPDYDPRFDRCFECLNHWRYYITGEF